MNKKIAIILSHIFTTIPILTGLILVVAACSGLEAGLGLLPFLIQTIIGYGFMAFGGYNCQKLF